MKNEPTFQMLRLSVSRLSYRKNSSGGKPIAILENIHNSITIMPNI